MITPVFADFFNKCMRSVCILNSPESHETRLYKNYDRLDSYMQRKNDRMQIKNFSNESLIDQTLQASIIVIVPRKGLARVFL